MRNIVRTAKTRTYAPALFLALLCFGWTGFQAQAQAQDRTAPRQVKRKVQPIYETDKAWEFKKDHLVFYNPSHNPGGMRFLRWKDYTWIVTKSKIVVIDSRPYGTRLQGLRHQRIKGNKIQRDKDLMNDLKKQARKIRKANDPNRKKLPVNLDIGLGFGFRF
jgi:hypothetical protein